MLHVLNFSYDGIEGVSTLKPARQTLGIATDNEEAAAGFFKSGSATSGILTVEGARLSKEQKELLRQFAASMGELDGDAGKGIFGRRKK